MYRSAGILLVLACVLASQWVGLGHAHCGATPASHDLRPHFHTHADGTVHHHQHQQPDGFGISGQQDGHDADAIFLDRVDAVVKGRFLIDEEGGASLTKNAVEFCLPSDFSAAVSSQEVITRIRLTHDGPRSAACPLYLWQLNLLI